MNSPAPHELGNTWQEMRRGVNASLPICISVAVYGVAFGVLATQAGLEVRMVALMSGTVYAGASQFAALQFWHAPLAVGTIILAVFVINLRLVLIAGSLASTFKDVPPGRALAAMFFAADANWALTMTEAGRGHTGPAFYLGNSLVLYVTWFCSTISGAIAGRGILIDPASYGVDFVFTAVFIALIVGMWGGKRDLAPWLAAACAAVLVHWLWPDGTWHVIAAGLAGALVGAAAGTAGDV